MAEQNISNNGIHADDHYTDTSPLNTKPEPFWSSPDDQVEVDGENGTRAVADKPTSDEVVKKGERESSTAGGDEDEDEDDEDDEDYNPSSSESDSDGGEESSELSEEEEDIESDGLDADGLLEKDRQERKRLAEQAGNDDEDEEGEEDGEEEEYEYKEPRVGPEVQVRITDRLSDDQIAAMRRVHRFYSPDPRVGSVQWAGDVIAAETTGQYVQRLSAQYSNMTTQLSVEKALSTLYRSGFDTDTAYELVLRSTAEFSRVKDTITPAEHDLMLYFLEAHHAAKQKPKDWKFAAREFIKTAPVGHVLNHYYMWKGSPAYVQWRRDLMKRLFGEPVKVLVNGVKRGDLQRVYVDGSIDWEDVNQSKKEAAMIAAATAESKKVQPRTGLGSEAGAEREMKRRHDRILAMGNITLHVVTLPPKSILQHSYCTGDVMGINLPSASP